MKKTAIILLLLFCATNLGGGIIERFITPFGHDYLEMEDYVKKYAGHQYANRIIEVIKQNHSKYLKDTAIEPIHIARQARAESNFKFWAKSHKQAYGMWQIQPRWWSHLLYQVDNNSLVHKLHRTNFEGHIKYFYYIGHNSEMNAMIMKDYLKQAKGDLPLALVYYLDGPGGTNYTIHAKTNYRYKMNIPYVRKVMYGEF